MEIQYLKKMKQTPIIDGIENFGVSEDSIRKIEIEIGKKFPIAFREFLFLGGNEANMIADMDHRLFIYEKPNWQEMQQYCKAAMEEEGVKADKDFWAFAALDGGEQFHFFYFDEGDDPPVYYYCSCHDNDDFTDTYAGIIKINEKFSDYINEEIDNKKRSGY